MSSQRFSSIDRWTAQEDTDFDIGCIHLDEPLGSQVGWFAVAALPPVLYDLAADPGECRNIADDPAHAGLLNEARGRMLSWRLRHADRTLTHLCATPAGLVDRRG